MFDIVLSFCLSFPLGRSRTAVPVSPVKFLVEKMDNFLFGRFHSQSYGRC